MAFSCTWTTFSPEVKEKWGQGEWAEEPDVVFFLEKESGLRCNLLRSWLGCWNAYVEIPPEHKAHSLDIPSLVSCHFGITFDSAGGLGLAGVEHWEKTDIRIVGFDCGHYTDLIPEMMKMRGESIVEHMRETLLKTGMTYRNVEWVQREAAHLAQQIGRL